MGKDLPLRPVGLYIHIPWCLTKCGYCDFYSLPFSKPALTEYLGYLEQEKRLYPELGQTSLNSVYFGGGTPSLLTPEQINRVLDGLRLAEHAEITLEVNPVQITPDFVAGLLDTPVNRLSLGLQSMLDEELIWLTRKHQAADIPAKLELLVEGGYTNLSGDLIYGLPNSTTGSLKRNLELFLKLPLNHISCYMLELHDGCRMASLRDSLPSEDQQADQYDVIRKVLRKAGFQQYEISNFAIRGFESRHNLLYWHCDDCYALGASAGGNRGGIRYKNPADLHEYYHNVASGLRMPDSDNGINTIQDYIMMTLRLREGLSFGEFSRRFGMDFLCERQSQVDRLTWMGMLEQDVQGVRLTEEAQIVSNAVIGELL